MAKYIDADRLKAEIGKKKPDYTKEAGVVQYQRMWAYNDVLTLIDSLQQDETQVDRMLCSQAWWEEQGWIMIPPDATIEGIDSLLKQVRKKLQQEQPEVDLEKETKRWWKEHLHLNPENQLWMDAHQSVVFALHFYELGRNAKKEE